MPNELQTGSIEPRSLPTTATLANSTTLKDIERKRRINKAVVVALSSLATVSLAFNIWAPWNFVVGAVLFIVAVVVAFFTNALTPEELDSLLSKLASASDASTKAASSKAPSSAPSGKDGAS